MLNRLSPPSVLLIFTLLILIATPFTVAAAFADVPDNEASSSIHRPKWWYQFDEGYAPYWEKDGTRDDWGFPTPPEVFRLPSLSTQQREKIQEIYMTKTGPGTPFAALCNKRHVLHQEWRSQYKQGGIVVPGVTPKLSNRKYGRRCDKMSRVIQSKRYEAWLAVKAVLRPEQIQELKQMAEGLFQQHAEKQKTVEHQTNEYQAPASVHTYHW